MLIIDCHAHITSFDEKKYQPKDNPLRPPKGMGSAEHLHQTMKANGVRAVRAIQTVSFYGYDNRYLCDKAKVSRSWMAGVCNVDPDDPHSPGYFRQFIREYGIRSLRSVPSPKRKTFDDDGVRALWRTAIEEGATVDIFLMHLEWVEGATKLLSEFPQMNVGFDHCMDLKPGPQFQAVLDAVLRLSRFKNLHPKLDFIATGAKQPFPCEQELRDACVKIIDAYGPERCVWSSSYPNKLWTPQVSYGEYIRMFSEVLPLKEQARRQILGETARRLWFPELK